MSIRVVHVGGLPLAGLPVFDYVTGENSVLSAEEDGSVIVENPSHIDYVERTHLANGQVRIEEAPTKAAPKASKAAEEATD